MRAAHKAGNLHSLEFVPLRLYPSLLCNGRQHFIWLQGSYRESIAALHVASGFMTFTSGQLPCLLTYLAGQQQSLVQLQMLMDSLQISDRLNCGCQNSMEA